MPPFLVTRGKFDRGDDLYPSFKVSFACRSRMALVTTGTASGTAQACELSVDALARTAEHKRRLFNQIASFGIPRAEPGKVVR